MSNCICSSFATRQCGACHSVSYCSTTCQRAHWSVHKGECKIHQISDDAAFQTNTHVGRDGGADPNGRNITERRLIIDIVFDLRLVLGDQLLPLRATKRFKHHAINAAFTWSSGGGGDLKPTYAIFGVEKCKSVFMSLDSDVIAELDEDFAIHPDATTLYYNRL